MVQNLQKFLRYYRFPILAAVGLRLATSLWVAFLWFFLDPHFPYTGIGIKETYNHLSVHQSLIGRMFIDAWLRWDGVHYMNLAWGGYESAGAADMNFYPLYPYLVKFVSPLFFNDIVLTGLFVSTVATIFAMIFFWKLITNSFHDEQLANWAVIAWAIYPTSFFLVAPFTDSLYACLALASLLMAQQKRWLFAGLLAALGGLTRSQGILLFMPIALQIGIDWYETRNRVNPSMLFGAALAPMGTALFFLWRSMRGMPDIVSSYNQYSKAAIVDPITGIYLAAVHIIQKPDLLQVIELISVILFLAVQIWMFRKPLFRREIPLLTYGILNILFILLKHNENATPLQSTNRYVLNVLPAFIGFAFLLLLLPEKGRKWVVTASVTCGLIVCSLYAMWVFIG